jgi:GT2 family glycosyltransferase
MSSSSTHDFRSALEDHSEFSAPLCPSVGIAVAIYNEAHHIEYLLNDILSQDYQALLEIWLVDGESSDGTLEILQNAQGRDPRLKIVRNPKRSTASALNIAFQAMNTDIVMRLDAHARYGPDMISQCVRTLLRTGAGGVGAIARPLEANTLVGKAITAAHKSPFGVGVASFRKEGVEGWVDTVWNGCYWKHVVNQVGLLREDLPRAEDNDFNERVRRLGYGLYLAPAIRACYRTRQTLGALWAQYYANGMGVARALFENRHAVGFRHLAPLALVSGLVMPLLLSLFWQPVALLSLMLMLPYLVVLLAAVGLSAQSNPGPHLALLPVVLLVLHTSYGCGTLWGLAMCLRQKGTREELIAK